MVGSEGYRFCEWRCRTPPPGDLPRSERYASFLRELPQDPEECLALIPRKSRASTRQARDRHGLSFVEDPSRLTQFHRLFLLNKRRLGSPAFSLDFFQDLMQTFPRRARVHVVVRGNCVVVAVLSFIDRDTLHCYFSGSVPEADSVGASNYMYWRLMQWAVEQGLERFDFGRSRVDSGPYHFKRHMGFEPRLLPYVFILGVGERIPEVHPSNKKFSLAQKVIRNLPVPVLEHLGPLLMSLVP